MLPGSEILVYSLPYYLPHGLPNGFFVTNWHMIKMFGSFCFCCGWVSCLICDLIAIKIKPKKVQKESTCQEESTCQN
jgi:hypothetical protein